MARATVRRCEKSARLLRATVDAVRALAPLAVNSAAVGRESDLERAWGRLECTEAE